MTPAAKALALRYTQMFGAPIQAWEAENLLLAALSAIEVTDAMIDAAESTKEDRQFTPAKYYYTQIFQAMIKAMLAEG